MKNYLIHLFLATCVSVCAQQQFTNSGNMKVHSGAAMTLFGDFINDGTFTDEGQKITFAGTSLQTIGGTSATTFSNLTLNNPVGSTLTANQNLKGVLTISQGTFSTIGKIFTLISDSTTTARIAPILGDFSGDITMQRYLASGPTDWRQLASPVSGVTINDWQDDFVTSGFPGSNSPSFSFLSVYSYDETTAGSSPNGYIAPTNASDPLTPGKGFFAYIGPTPVTVDVSGPPAKFNQTFTVSYTSSGGAAEDGWVLLGNPYPCAIDWTSGAWTKTNMNDAIYIWNPNLQQYASYVSGVSTNGGSSIIASSQSFWVQTNAASPSLSCTENVKYTGAASFVKAMNPFLTNLKLSFKGNNYSDETFIRFGNSATGKFDKQFDARKMLTSTPGVPSISSLDSTISDMSVNSLPVFNNEIKIPVRTIISSGYSGIYTIDCDSMSTIPNGYCVVLEDLATGVKTNLSNSASYSFFISDTTWAPRFLIHIRASHVVNAFAADCNGASTGKIVAEGKGQAPWNYIWKDATNTVIKSSFNLAGKDSVSNILAGDYFVYVSGSNSVCSSFITTVTVIQPEPVLANFNVPSATVQVNTGSLVVTNLSYNATSYTWNFGDGGPFVMSANPAPHVYNSLGDHTVVLVATNNGCSNVFTKVIKVTDQFVQGVEESLQEMNISVFPNPGDGLFNLIVKGAIPAGSFIEVFDVSGRKIFSQQLQGEKTEMDFRGKAKGTYFYRMNLGADKIMNGKLIIK